MSGPGKQLLRTEVGERIDHPDFSFLVDGLRDAIFQLLDVFGVGTDDVSDSLPNQHPRFFVLAGFRMVVGGTQITVEKDVINGSVTQPGAAIAAFRENGQVKYGCLIADGEPSKTIDILSYPNGVYGIFVRFTMRDDAIQNRLFWNPIAAPPVEFPRAIATRRSENWDIAVEITPPGPEWMKIGTVDRNPMTIVDLRPFFFEGKAANTYALNDTDWGSTADRNTDRALHGVGSLAKFAKAMLRQVQDIIGGTAQWWQNPQAGTASGAGSRSLTQLNTEKLARNGAQTMQGDFLPDGSNTRDVGSAAARWAEVHTYDAYVEDDLDVNGDTSLQNVTANDITALDYFYVTPLQGWHSFLGTQFKVHAVGGGSQVFTYSSGTSFQKTGTGAWYAFLAIHPPFGCDIGSIFLEVLLTINTATSILIDLVRTTLADGTVTVLDTFSFTANQALAFVDLGMTAADLSQQTYAYYLRIQETGATKDADFTVYYGRIRWDQDRVQAQ